MDPHRPSSDIGKDMPSADAPDAEEILHTPEPDPEAGFVAISEETLDATLMWWDVPRRVWNMAVSTIQFAWRRRIALVAIGLILISSELATRFVAPDYANRIYTDRLTGGHQIRMTPQLHRGEPVELSPPAGSRRIVGLGDSVTYGTGVSVESTWPKQAERFLNQDQRPEFQVLTAGLPGADLQQIMRAITEHWVDFEPDVLVVQISANMVSRAWIFRDEELDVPIPSSVSPAPMPSGLSAVKTSVKRRIQGLALPGLMTINTERLLHRLGQLDHRVDPEKPFGPLLAQGWQQADLDPNRWHDAWALFAEDLERLRSLCDQLGTRLLVVTTPSRFMLGDDFRDNLRFVPKRRLQDEFCRRAVELCVDQGIAVIDGLDVLREARRTADHWVPLYIINDATHLDPDGHEAIGRAVAMVLREAD
jgi:lysophospholipase L1-like esterase